MSSYLVVLPTKNESLVLEQNVRFLLAFLDALPALGDLRICIADNGSTDDTCKIAQKLSLEDSRIRWFHIDASGRGRAVIRAWNEAEEDVLCFMDADLSTHLDAFPHLLGEIRRGADMVYGSRFVAGSKVDRSLVREIVSRGYNVLTRIFLGLRAKDAQCGFKGLSKAAWSKLQKKVSHPGWFFDTELLVYAERTKMDVRAIPVSWTEARDKRRKSTVKLGRDIKAFWKDLKNFRAKLKAEEQEAGQK